MTVIATLVVPHQEFELGELLEIDPGIRVRMQRVVPTGDAVMPYFWVSRQYSDDVIDTLAGDESVESVELLDATADEALIKVEWTEGINGFIQTVIEHEVSLLGAFGTGDVWRFQARFADRDRLSEFYRQCQDAGIAIEIDSVLDPLGDGDGGAGLTEDQRRTLEEALDSGYFEIPRGITLIELGERLGVSDSAVSQRLRRGLATLVEASLVDERQ